MYNKIIAPITVVVGAIFIMVLFVLKFNAYPASI